MPVNFDWRLVTRTGVYWYFEACLVTVAIPFDSAVGGTAGLATGSESARTYLCHDRRVARANLFSSKRYRLWLIHRQAFLNSMWTLLRGSRRKGRGVKRAMGEHTADMFFSPRFRREIIFSCLNVSYVPPGLQTTGIISIYSTEHRAIGFAYLCHHAHEARVSFASILSTKSYSRLGNLFIRMHSRGGDTITFDGMIKNGPCRIWPAYSTCDTIVYYY